MIEFDRPLRIAHLTPTYFSKNSVIGGGERYVSNLAEAINAAAAALGLPVAQTIISIADQAECYQTRDGVTIRLLKNGSPFLGNMDGLSAELFDFLEPMNLVHIHQSLTLFGAYAAAIARSRSIPIVATDLGGGDSDLMLSAKGLQLADAVLSISDYAKSLITSSYSGPHKVLIGPVDTGFFKPDPVVKRQATAICVGRILPHKGIDRLIAALPPALPLKVVGKIYDQSYFDYLTDLASAKHVEFFTAADDEQLLQHYQSSSLFLQGSTHKDCYGNTVHKPELMGLTTLEAMSCGLPAIISNAGSLRELVPDARFGLTFADLEDLHIKLQDFAEGKWPKNDVAAMARDYVVDQFSFMRIGTRLLEIYGEVLRRHNPVNREAFQSLRKTAA